MGPLHARTCWARSPVQHPPRLPPLHVVSSSLVLLWVGGAAPGEFPVPRGHLQPPGPWALPLVEPLAHPWGAPCAPQRRGAPAPGPPHLLGPRGSLTPCISM